MSHMGLNFGGMGFYFGENDSFFYDGPLSWERLNVPKGIEDVFQGLYSVIDLYYIALGPNGSYYMSYLRNDGNVKYVDDVVHSNLPEDLESYLEPSTKETYSQLLDTTITKPTIGLSIPKTRVWLGPGKSYYAEDDTYFQHEDLPPRLVDCIEKYGHSENSIRILTFGYGGSYFVSFQDGSKCYDLRPCSKALDEIIDEVASSKYRAGIDEIEYLSVSPFHPNRWILFFKDGTYYCSFPESWRALCDPISAATAAYFKKVYPKATPLTSFTRKNIIAKLKAYEAADGMAALSLDTTGNTTADPGTSSSSGATIQSNTTTTGGVDFSAGESTVAGHDYSAAPAVLPTAPSIFHTANIGIDLQDASNADTVSFATTGHSYGWHGDGGAGSGGGYSGGDSGGGGGGGF